MVSPCSPDRHLSTGGLSSQNDEASKSYDSLLVLRKTGTVTTRRPRSLYVARSYDCILDTVDENSSSGRDFDAYNRRSFAGTNLTDDQMAAIRRTESDRRIGGSG